jgi:hypothetical protein
MVTNRCITASFSFAAWVAAMKLASAGGLHGEVSNVVIVVDGTCLKGGRCSDPDMLLVQMLEAEAEA